MLGVLEGRDDEDRLLVEPVTQRAQHGTGLGGVRGSCDELQGHGGEL
jgi:hypothetical protein